MRVALALSLLTIGWLAARPLTPPASSPGPVASEEFSVTRAIDTLRLVARKPHPTGSAAQADVRRYILAQAKALGLRPRVQWARAGGRVVKNVLVEVPGSDSTGDVLLTAHYDSAPGAPGAGDAGVAVSSILEAMRVLSAEPGLRNDLVFLFTDAEEAGRLGTMAFLDASPATRQVGALVAVEAVPSSGPTTLQQTTPGAGWLVAELADASAPIWANSAVDAVERSDDDSDFDLLAAAGLPGIEFENPKDATRYHNARDTPDAIDPGLLQGHGETILALARHLGALDLAGERSSGDRVFITLPVLGLFTYPVWLSALVVGLAPLALAAVLGVAGIRAELSLREGLLGVACFPLAVLVLSVLAAAAWELVTAAQRGADELAFPDFDGSAIVLAGFYFVGAGLFISIMSRLARRVGAAGLTAGALLWLAVVDIAVGFSEPLAGPVASWMLLGGTIALAVAVAAPTPWRVPLLALSAVPGLVLVVPFLALAAFSPEAGAALPTAILALLLGSLLPQLMTITGDWPGRSDPDRSP